jgi:hypothetical protein
MGVDLRNETASCQCGNMLKLKETKKFFESTSQSEIASAVGRMNAELEGGTEEWERVAGISSEGREDDPFTKLISTASSITDSQERLEFVARNLTETLGSFTRKDLSKTLRILGMKDVDECVDIMLRESIIYEPEPGVFRAV